MTLCVLDASLAVELAFPKLGAAFLLVSRQLRSTGAVVPDVWHWEFVNVALRIERQRRLPQHQTDAAIKDIRALIAETELGLAEDATTRLSIIARAEHLSLFDAAYLELAERRALPLATLDGGLAAAAYRRGVALLPLMP